MGAQSTIVEKSFLSPIWNERTWFYVRVLLLKREDRYKRNRLSSLLVEDERRASVASHSQSCTLTSRLVFLSRQGKGARWRDSSKDILLVEVLIFDGIQSAHNSQAIKSVPHVSRGRWGRLPLRCEMQWLWLLCQQSPPECDCNEEGKAWAFTILAVYKVAQLWWIVGCITRQNSIPTCKTLQI